jgi:hypothetical protein
MDAAGISLGGNMAFNPQFKVNQMAKDMGLKSKDLTDLLASKGIGDVKS